MLQETKIKISERDILTMLVIYEDRLEQRVKMYNENMPKEQQLTFTEYAEKFHVAGWEEYNRLNKAWWNMKTDEEYIMFERV